MYQLLFWQGQRPVPYVEAFGEDICAKMKSQGM
jgi:hypothetical protein